MNVKNILGIVVITVLLIPLVPRQAEAQWGIGASYEIRNEEPQSGFGVRLERDFGLPVLSLSLRAHATFFSEENNVSREGATYGDFKSYDIGLAGIAGVSLGLVKPYAGLGIGSETVDFTREDTQEPDPSDSESKFYWNAFIGSEVAPIPVLNPFVEYRFSKFSDTEAIPDSQGRLIFGITLRF